MNSNPPAGESEFPARRDFTSTHWSVVLAARGDDDSQAKAALEALCKTYWYPLYVFIRRRGYSFHDAEDLTQQFFTHLLEKNRLQQVHPSKGRFRHFLLAAIKNFLVNEWAKGRALKRGGACTFHSLDVLTAEKRYAREPADHCTPDALYDKRWALTLLDEALAQLRLEYAEAGKEALFEVLREYLTPGCSTATQADAARRLGKSEDAVAMDIHRLKGRYRECLRQRIADTVNTPQEVQSEITDLLAILGS